MLIYHGGTSLVLLPLAMFLTVVLAAKRFLFEPQCIHISQPAMAVCYRLRTRRFPWSRIRSIRRLDKPDIMALVGAEFRSDRILAELAKNVGEFENIGQGLGTMVLVEMHEGKHLLLNLRTPEEFLAIAQGCLPSYRPQDR